MISPHTPMDLALRLLAQGNDERAFTIAKSGGIPWSVLLMERDRRRQADFAAWNKSKGRAA